LDAEEKLRLRAEDLAEKEVFNELLQMSEQEKKILDRDDILAQFFLTIYNDISTQQQEARDKYIDDVVSSVNALSQHNPVQNATVLVDSVLDHDTKDAVLTIRERFKDTEQLVKDGVACTRTTDTYRDPTYRAFIDKARERYPNEGDWIVRLTDFRGLQIDFIDEVTSTTDVTSISTAKLGAPMGGILKSPFAQQFETNSLIALLSRTAVAFLKEEIPTQPNKIDN
jgi:hypothetical protein